MQLEIGDSVRYQGLGTGRVVDHRIRDFGGKDRVFAVISFPHRDMTAQIPLGDPKVSAKLCKVLSATACRKLVRQLRDPGERVARTWDQREEHGLNTLRNGGPEEWTALLRSYASARGEGLQVSASDTELVRTAIELLASELASATDADYSDAHAQVKGTYDTTITQVRERAAERQRTDVELAPA